MRDISTIISIYGNNTIELISPRSDDADDSPHFPLPKIEMMVEMSRIANEYVGSTYPSGIRRWTRITRIRRPSSWR